MLECGVIHLLLCTKGRDPMGVRRVVTGHDKDGRSIIVSDELAEPIAARDLGETYVFWSADESPSFPNDGQNPQARTAFPPAGGFRFFMFTIDPRTPAPSLVGAADPADSGRPAMRGQIAGFHETHETDTIDFEVVLQGEAILTVSSGQQVTLKPGEVVVHNGECHAWSNEGSVPAVLVGCVVGGRRVR
jgi:mannose-6-phosphate isomerase-like protein (cupin superfamily)